MDSFVHLHVHPEYPMLDGAAKIAPLFAGAQRLGMPAVASRPSVRDSRVSRLRWLA